MKLVAQSGDRTENAVVVAEDDGSYQVTLGDCSYRVSYQQLGESSSLIVDGEQFEARVRAIGGGRYQVTSRDFGGEVRVFDPLSLLAETQSARSGARQLRKATAYMPGRVVTVLVAVGEQVTPGQGVIVLEAMKMENEIQAESAGVVKAIHVVPGQAVEAGEPLFEIE